MELGTGLRDVLDRERAFVPDDVYAIGSMLGFDERLLLHWAARTTDAGAVVDLGAFLGGSTLALASGAQHRSATVYSYDRFVLSGDWERTWLPEGTELEIGDSTRPVVEANLRRVLNRVVLREGDVEDREWHDGPIGVLFIDVAKSWRIADHVWRTFLAAVVPGAVIIQQDLVHWGHPWCAVIMELLTDHFEYLGWAWYSSAAYRCVSPVEGVPERLRDALSCDELVALVDRAAERVGEPAAGSIRLSAGFVFGAFNRFDDARERCAEIRAAYDGGRMPHIEEGYVYLEQWLGEVESGRRVVG